MRTLSGEPTLPILQTPSAGHCLDTHGKASMVAFAGATIRRDKGSRLVGGTRLVVFPRPNRSQCEKATSRDPLSSRDPLPLAPFKRGAGAGGGGGVPAGRGVPARRGVGVPARGVLRSRIVGIPRAGSPQRAGTPRLFPD